MHSSDFLWHDRLVAILDRAGALDRLEQGVHLELGCGDQPRPDYVIGIDTRDLPTVDIVGDVFEVLSSFPAQCVLSVSSSHFLEHIEDLESLLWELARVMRPGAEMTATVPHFSNPYFFSDPTHRRFFGLYTFCYLAEDKIGFLRDVPDYGRRPPFDLVHIELHLHSRMSGRMQRVVRRHLEAFVNGSNRRQEKYEAHLAQVVSCFDYTARLRRQQ